MIKPFNSLHFSIFKNKKEFVERNQQNQIFKWRIRIGICLYEKFKIAHLKFLLDKNSKPKRIKEKINLIEIQREKKTKLNLPNRTF